MHAEPALTPLTHRLRALAEAAAALLQSAQASAGTSLRRTFWDQHHAITQLPVYIEVTASISEEPGLIESAASGASDGASPESIAAVASLFLSAFLLNVIQDDCTVNPTRFSALADEAHQYLRERKQTIRIRHFYRQGSMQTAVSVGEGQVLRALKKDEQPELVAALETWIGQFRTEQILDGEVLVFEQSRVCAPSASRAAVAEMMKLGKAMLAYLRIHVSSKMVFLCRMQESGSFWGKASSPNSGNINQALGSRAIVDAAHLAHWPVACLLLIMPKGALKVALARFDMLSDHHNPDRILDQIIVLEALFSDDDKQELSHKLSQRVANFIGADFASRAEHFKNMKKAYTARSKISHGKELPANLRGIDDTIARILQAVLTRYLACVPSGPAGDSDWERKFLGALDDMCLGGPGPAPS